MFQEHCFLSGNGSLVMEERRCKMTTGQERKSQITSVKDALSEDNTIRDLAGISGLSRRTLHNIVTKYLKMRKVKNVLLSFWGVLVSN